MYPRAPWHAFQILSASLELLRIKRKLEEVDVIFSNGGNPDLLGRLLLFKCRLKSSGFVLMKFAPMLGELIVERVRSGQLLYLGRSAGAMVGSKDFGATYEPMPLLLELLLKGDTKGLALAGRCVPRPHYERPGGPLRGV